MSNKLLSFVSDELQRRGWSIRELARRGGMSHTTMVGFLNEQRPASADVCMALSRALGVPKEDVMRMAGLLPDVPDDLEGQKIRLYDMFKALSPKVRENALTYVSYLYKQEQEK